MKNKIEKTMLCMNIIAALIMIGCNKKTTAESLLKKMSEKMKDIDSLSGKVFLDLDIKTEEKTTNIDIDLEYEMISNIKSYMMGKVKSNLYSKEIINMVEMYQIKEENEIIKYEYADRNDKWYKNSLDAKSTDVISKNSIEKMQNWGEEFTFLGKCSKVNEKDCLVLEGELSGDKAIALVGECLKVMPKLDGVFSFTAKEAKKWKIPCNLEIDKNTHFPAKITFDMEALLQGLVALLEINGEQANGKLEMSMTFETFNQVKDIEISKEIKTEAVEQEMYQDEYEEYEVYEVKPVEGLGDTWESMTVQVNEKILTFPCAYSEIKEVGFELDKRYTSEELMIKPGKFEAAAFSDSYGNIVAFEVANDSELPIEITKGEVRGICVTKRNINESAGILFPGGVTIGTSLEEVIESYGDEYEKLYEGDDLISCRWMNGDVLFCNGDFNTETKKLESVLMADLTGFEE